MPTVAFNSQLGRDQFMQLLTTQLRNQDPLEPVKQQDFLGQLAQFSQLQGIEKLNTNFAESLKFQQLSQGSSLVGSRGAVIRFLMLVILLLSQYSTPI